MSNMKSFHKATDTNFHSKQGTISSEFKRNWQLWVMIFPMLIWLALYGYKPLWGMLIAFQHYSPFKGISGSDWTGIQNFQELMFGPNQELFWRAFRNTVIISLYGLVIGFPIPILLAILIHELRGVRFKKIIQTVTYAPYFISEVVVCSLALTMLALNTGLINVLAGKVLGFFNIQYTQVQFMANSDYFRIIYTLVGIWKNAGFDSIVFFAALCAIPEELYEAARVDGASRIKQLWHISLPGIMNTIVIMLIIRVGNILNVGYERVLLLYNPGIYDKADILSTFTYRMGIATNPNYGQSTAASLINAVIGFILVIGTNWLSRKYSETSLW